MNKWDKWNNEKDKSCYIDIDGVLNMYPEPWLKYIEKEWAGINTVSDPTNLNIVKKSVPYQIYKDLKYSYRESGMKEKLPVNPGAVQLTQELKKKGYHIVIITSRPVEEHPSLYKQTLNWLQKNNIQFDNILFDPNKEVSVLLRYPKLLFGIDDHRTYANLIASWGYQMYLFNNEYNRGPTHTNVKRIDKLLDLLEWI